MKKCLDCVHLRASMKHYKDAPKMFQHFLYLECDKYKHAVVGYDRKGESGYCNGFEKRKEQI